MLVRSRCFCGGAKSGRFFGKHVELVGGVILIFMGLRILITHIF